MYYKKVSVLFNTELFEIYFQLCNENMIHASVWYESMVSHNIYHTRVCSLINRYIQHRISLTVFLIIKCKCDIE